jgi:hypothetical protein
MKKTILTTKAREGCANWNKGTCLGVILSRKEGYQLTQYIDSKLATKQCSVEQGCTYFQKIVAPSI